MDMQDIVITGGGLNGPALALAAARAGLTVTIIDRLPASARRDADFDGRGYAMAMGSVRLLGALGLWDRLKADAQPIARVVASDGRPGEGASPLLLDLDAAEVEEGPFGHMLEDRKLRPVLLDALTEQPNITQLAEETVTGQQVHPGHVTVTLAQVLAEARRRGEDIGTLQVLDRYRQWRSFDRASLALATDTFNRLFSNDNPLLRIGRDLGMAAVTAAPGLRRRFMREAAGLTGDVPRLLQGLPA